MSSKLLKSELKEIVKECLVEILNEGIMPSAKVHVRSQQDIPKRSQRRKSFDHVSWASEIERPESTDQNLREVANSLTSDPILAEVLADSKRTMLDQIAAEKKGAVSSAGDFAQRKVSESDPMALFENSRNWASLAFDGK